jgi:ribonuclease HII
MGICWWSCSLKKSLKQLECTTYHEALAWQSGYLSIAGVDEAGRGSLFGPVVAAAVILDLSQSFVANLNDSKQLTAKQRDKLYGYIRETAFAWAIAEVDASRVDAWNVLQATRQAMALAITNLPEVPDYLLVDAVKIDLSIPQENLIHGDCLSVSIAAASILAKVWRDRLMDKWHMIYPQYGFNKNRGYATPDHLKALVVHGATPDHRQSYAPVQKIKGGVHLQLDLFHEDLRDNQVQQQA